MPLFPLFFFFGACFQCALLVYFFGVFAGVFFKPPSMLIWICKFLVLLANIRRLFAQHICLLLGFSLFTLKRVGARCVFQLEQIKSWNARFIILHGGACTHAAQIWASEKWQVSVLFPCVKLQRGDIPRVFCCLPSMGWREFIQTIIKELQREWVGALKQSDLSYLFSIFKIWIFKTHWFR